MDELENILEFFASQGIPKSEIQAIRTITEDGKVEVIFVNEGWTQSVLDEAEEILKEAP